MTSLPLEVDSRRYTVAHIVPESAGGKDWTLLCRKCNSEFGRQQDKWFGEYLCVLKDPAGTFLHAKSKSKYITVNDVAVAGQIVVSEVDGAVEIILPINRNPPGKVEALPLGETLTVQFTPELVKRINEIQVGYITAAYLTWFKAIGYNWVMQSTQESVRRQIIECDYSLSGAKVTELQGDVLHEPAIGVVVNAGYVYPCCLMYDKAVIFPPPNGNKAPSLETTLFGGSCSIHLLELGIVDWPYSVNFDGGLVVLPDMLKKDPPIPDHMLYVDQNPDEEAEWLTLTK